ncbi:hypothetical protein BDZ45DRAFT_743988 [Acephala macrosclerotiorum]|nr:hypothetical protein BDZ45DRAFT_743988 [Acephala macrosclerotiorum]
MPSSMEETPADIEAGTTAVAVILVEPGTVVLENSRSELKHGQDGTLVLYPQPSEDLNYSLVDFFSSDPYEFSTSGTELLNLAPFIGAVVAAPYSGLSSDWAIIWLSKRNDGVYEPEFHLYLAISPMLIRPVSLFLYGFSLVKVKILGDALVSVSSATI